MGQPLLLAHRIMMVMVVTQVMFVYMIGVVHRGLNVVMILMERLAKIILERDIHWQWIQQELI